MCYVHDKKQPKLSALNWKLYYFQSIWTENRYYILYQKNTQKIHPRWIHTPPHSIILKSFSTSPCFMAFLHAVTTSVLGLPTLRRPAFCMPWGIKSVLMGSIFKNYYMLKYSRKRSGESNYEIMKMYDFYSVVRPTAKRSYWSAYSVLKTTDHVINSSSVSII